MTTPIIRVLNIPSSFNLNWEILNNIYKASCHCTAITTDLETYIEVEALQQDCLDELCNNFISLGLVEVPKDRIRE